MMEPVLRLAAFVSNLALPISLRGMLRLKPWTMMSSRQYACSGNCGSKSPKKPCPAKTPKRPKPANQDNKSEKRNSCHLSNPCRKSPCCGKCKSPPETCKPPTLNSIKGSCGSARRCTQQKPSHPLEYPCGPPPPPKYPPMNEPPCPCPKMPEFGGPCEIAKRKETLWRNLVRFVALPAVIFGSLIIIPDALEEHKRPRPPFRPYEYLYIRHHRFPWGDGNRTLFHNPYKNALPPDGYEEPDPYGPPVETKNKRRKRGNY